MQRREGGERENELSAVKENTSLHVHILLFFSLQQAPLEIDPLQLDQAKVKLKDWRTSEDQKTVVWMPGDVIGL